VTDCTVELKVWNQKFPKISKNFQMGFLFKREFITPYLKNTPWTPKDISGRGVLERR
jgi:hypothetical protein